MPEHTLMELETYSDLSKHWLFEEAGPLWLSTGRNEKGMFAERLDSHGLPDKCDRRTRVQARQIFAFCELGRLGWNGAWRAAVDAAATSLVSYGRRADGFFVHRFSDAGDCVDSRADLYDQAFVLFALAHAGRACQRPDLFQRANELMDCLEQHWRHPNGGFREGEIDPPPRRQNPHMHLLEASIAMWNSTADARWSNLAIEIANLCRSKFIEPKSGALLEYFSEDLVPCDTVQGSIVEPGHCFEWAWLFEILGEKKLVDSEPCSSDLVGFARRAGINPASGLCFNEVLLDGEIRDGGTRLWQQGERLKAALARFRRTASRADYSDACEAFLGLKRHLTGPKQGLWHERADVDGNWVIAQSPASSFYHIVSALSELIQTVETTSEVRAPILSDCSIDLNGVGLACRDSSATI